MQKSTIWIRSTTDINYQKEKEALLASILTLKDYIRPHWLVMPIVAPYKPDIAKVMPREYCGIWIGGN